MLQYLKKTGIYRTGSWSQKFQKLVFMLESGIQYAMTLIQTILSNISIKNCSNLSGCPICGAPVAAIFLTFFIHIRVMNMNQRERRWPSG